MYQNILDKSSRKFSCPKCSKKSFVKFIENETGNYLSDDFGRCDRESKCGYYSPPPQGKRAYLIDFLDFSNISDKACKLVDLNALIHIVPKSQILEQSNRQVYISEWFLKTNECKISYLNCESKYFDSEGIVNVISVKEQAPAPEIKYFDFQKVSDSEERYNNNNFVKFLMQYFDVKQVGKALEAYHIGTSNHWEGATIFWQIDKLNRVHTGKIMLYNEVTGKRVKKPYNCINWVHKKLDIAKENIEQCLFGLHRIAIDLDKPIAIVEAEKTAIIMSIEAPDFLWLATGSKGNLKEELLKPLKNRAIILHPDKGEFKDWQKVVNELKAKGYKIAISDCLEQMELEEGYDLADYCINEMI
jgi:hypothetical protein